MKSLLILSAALMTSAANADTVSLVSGNDYRPYADQALPEGGMTTDLVRKAFAEVKKDIKIEWLPWARGFNDAKEGKFAATYPYLKTAEREADFLYSDVVVKIQDFAFVKKDGKKFDFANPASLAGTTICLPLGWATTPKLADMVKTEKIKKSSPKDISTCVKMVESGRADYFISDEAQGTAALKTGGVTPGSVVMADVPLADNSLYLIASKKLPGSQELLTSFNKGLEAIKKNGSYAKTIKLHSK